MFKFDAADTGLASFETDYYFDAVGNWYISTDGVNYTQKNGSAATGLLSGEPEYGTSLGTVRDDIDGRTCSVQITRDPETRFYQLWMRAQFIVDRDYAINFYQDAFVLYSEIFRYLGADEVDAFPTNCQIRPTDGDVIFSATPSTGYNNLSESVDGRRVNIDIQYDEPRGEYKVTARVLHFLQNEVCTTYLKDPQTRAVEFYLFDVSEAGANTAASYYYFNDAGDWFYSTDGVTYTKKNGEVSSGSLIAESAYSLTQANGHRIAEITVNRVPNSSVYLLRAHIEHFTARNPEIITHPNGDFTYLGFRTTSLPDFSALASDYIITPLFVQQNPDNTYNYVFTVKAKNSNFSSGSNTTTYGTPEVSIEDTVVDGASSLPDTSSAISYNTQRTQEVETEVLAPRYDTNTGTYSYISRKITRWAPHADQTTGDPGYVEGPSEIRVDTQEKALAAGVGAGYPGMGSWAGGGRGRVRYVSNADGHGGNLATPDIYNGATVEATKAFQPYHVGIARSRKLRTTSRFYFYVTDPEPNQYPVWVGSPIEDHDGSEIDNHGIPYITSITVEDDEPSVAGTPSAEYGPAYNQPYVASTTQSNEYYADGTDYHGKLVTYTYSDGTFTIAYYEAKFSNSTTATGTSAEQYSTNVHWRELKFIRTYAAGATPNYDYSATVATTGVITATTDEWNAADPALYEGHYKIANTNFYTEAIRHRIVKVAENLYALVVEKIEATPWQWDQLRKWVLNAEGDNMRYSVPPTNPLPTAGGSGDGSRYIW
jgi:hypothetical protein